MRAIDFKTFKENTGRNLWKDTVEVGKISPEESNSYSVITSDPYEKERRRTLINSDVAGHKEPLMMLGIKKKKNASI